MSRAPVILLLDEVQHAASHPAIAEAHRHLTRQGTPVQLLALPCPSQPSHPILPGTGKYTPWVNGPLPAHSAIVASSLSTALLGAALSMVSTSWLIDSDPFCAGEMNTWETDVSMAALRSGSVLAVATNSVLALHLQNAHGLSARTWPLVPSRTARADPVREPAPLKTGTAADSKQTILIDHSARSAEAVVLTAEAFSGMECRTILLTDLLKPPYQNIFSEVRIRPRDRSVHYRKADIIVKLDSLKYTLTPLSQMLASGSSLAMSREAICALPVSHGVECWVFSDNSPVSVRRDTELLLSNEKLRMGLSQRGHGQVQRWRAEADATTYEPPTETCRNRESIDEWVATVLSEAEPRVWNSSILRHLAEYYDSRMV